jgi:hypothetical protein
LFLLVKKGWRLTIIWGWSVSHKIHNIFEKSWKISTQSNLDSRIWIWKILTKTKTNESQQSRKSHQVRKNEPLSKFLLLTNRSWTKAKLTSCVTEPEKLDIIKKRQKWQINGFQYRLELHKSKVITQSNNRHGSKDVSIEANCSLFSGKCPFWFQRPVFWAFPIRELHSCLDDQETNFFLYWSRFLRSRLLNQDLAVSR